MKLILSTSNVLTAGSSIYRSTKSKSNAEFISSLRANFDASSIPTTPNHHTNGNGTSLPPQRPSYTTWTARRDNNTLEIPTLDFTHSALQEEREQYDITLKLFYLPGASIANREQQTREALDLVLKELHMPSIDLLIVSFPGIYFDEEEDCPDKISTRGPVESAPEDITSLLATWKTIESLHDSGLVKKLGVAEFGHDRLRDFVEATRVKPSVDQINLRDCCSVPKDLLLLAKGKEVELLVHNDCSNVLPRGTVRELLGPGPGGAGILAESPAAVRKGEDEGSTSASQESENATTGSKRKSLHGEDAFTNGNSTAKRSGSGSEGPLKGEVSPQWVVKYTAVVKNRGVVENKGYFAGAEVVD